MLKIPAGIKTLVKLIVLLSIIGAGYYYLTAFHKEDLDKFCLKFDTLGITSIGRAEQDRIYAIRALSDRNVHGPQQEALINRTVFLGADNEMVALALGSPLKKPEINSLGQQVWIYYFDDYSRPTYLYFEKRGTYWVLVKAEKTSH